MCRGWWVPAGTAGAGTALQHPDGGSAGCAAAEGDLEEKGDGQGQGVAPGCDGSGAVPLL